MTTFTTEDRLAAQKRLADKIVAQAEAAAKPPVVIVDSGASHVEPIPFAGLVDIDNQGN